MEKDFFDVFPSLKVKKELEELLDMVFVTRVSCNPSRTHIWVYIKSERWIHKKHIFELEEQIERQIFAGLNVTVTVIEKFRLSGQYNPQNFLEMQIILPMQIIRDNSGWRVYRPKRGRYREWMRCHSR